MTEPNLIKLDTYKSLLAPRARDAHKGCFGHVLIVGGNSGMAGAVRLAGEAALRVGAGLVSVATKPEHVTAIVSGCPEIMVHGIKKPKELKKLANKATVIVIGPGLGQTAWSKKLFEQTLALPQPKIIDADGLNLLAKNPKKSAEWILTPHPAEAARLLNNSVEYIQNDRIHAVRQLQQTYGGTAILKGAGSLIATEKSLSICHAGNPGMASGGMGDVLSGVIGGLLAQGLLPQQAAELGVYLHAYAADLAAAQLGERGLIARDLLPYLHQLVNT